jgi:hypothetical protein
MNSEDDEFNRIEREAQHRLNVDEINKAFDEEYVKYRAAFPKDYRLPKPWVGLTDEEAMQICVDCGCLSEDWLVLLEAIEAKLKEKNLP